MDMKALQRDLSAIITCMKSLQVRNGGERERGDEERGCMLYVVCVYVCVSVDAKTRKSHTHIRIHTHLHLCIYIYIQSADLSNVSKEEMYAPPNDAQASTPLREDVVTEGGMFIYACMCTYDS